MHITDYELFAVPPRWLFLKLETSDGTVGWGEPAIAGRLKTVKTTVEDLIKGQLLASDPLRTEYHWRSMYTSYHRGGPMLMSALAGIDQALWDIKGRHYDAPVHRLLGGPVRDRILSYHWIGGDTPELLAKSAEQRVQNGYKAVKVSVVDEFYPIETPAAIEKVQDGVKAIREAVGDDIYLGIDFHGRVSKPMALKLIRAVEPYDPMFIDQPLLPNQEDAYEVLASQTTVPISTGERHYSRYDFKRLLFSNAVSIIQPDITHTGGISEMRKILSMAETFDVFAIPHGCLGPITLAASLQVGFSTHNIVMQEQDINVDDPESSSGLAYLEDTDPFPFENGFIERPTKPGLGINIDEDYVRKQAKADVDWYNPTWHHDDGSLAEW